MNIYLLTTEYNIGGGEQNLIDLSMEYKNRGHCCVVCLPCAGKLAEKLKQNKVEVILYGLRMIRRRWLCGFPVFIDICMLMKIIIWGKKKHIRPDVIHANSVNMIPLGYLLSKIFQVKLIWTCHGNWEIKSNIKKWFIGKMCNTIVAITPEIKHALEPIANVKLIPLGIDDAIAISEECKEHIPKKRIVCIGRFQKIKGQDLAVKALALLNKKYNNLELHFFGGFMTGNHEERKWYDYVCRLVAEYKLDEMVYFHGFEPRIREFMSAYDVLCIASRYESFSIVALEGLNRGMTILAPFVGGPAYIIENNVSGLFYRCGDFLDMAHKLEDILENRIILDKALIKKRGKEFSIKIQATRLLKEYV